MATATTRTRLFVCAGKYFHPETINSLRLPHTPPRAFPKKSPFTEEEQRRFMVTPEDIEYGFVAANLHIQKSGTEDPDHSQPFAYSYTRKIDPYS
jgi:hypothetical protein